MIDPRAESSALLIGLLSGAIFFAGLWWTVRTGTAARNSAAWFAVSSLLRASLSVVGFYYVAADGWQALLLCLGGFLIARGAIFRWVRVGRRISHAP